MIWFDGTQVQDDEDMLPIFVVVQTLFTLSTFAGLEIPTR